MTEEREIFLQALEQPVEARAAFVARLTAHDPKLKESVEALMANDQGDRFLEQGVATLLRDSMETDGTLISGEERIGDCIGRYKIVEKIGEGGFGIVYRAEQTEPVRRHVALKVIRVGMDTKSVVARFEAERQALALMDHPSIARVLDGGATKMGRPFFVMELVRGVRITEYCAVNQVPLEDRLKLFIQLCHAIQHAHQKGIIHRDLKPSNILVTIQDGQAAPKVIDFGIAKAIEEPLTEKTVLTNFHAFLGTPAYTSPEQAQMTGSDVDTRSDIYSLGVLLYELLTGVTPLDGKELTHSGIDGMRRMIQEVEPATPSTRLRRIVAETPTQPAPMRVERDLDSIVMKCLEKDRTRRYATAQQLAEDLQRYLVHEPVIARPQSVAYRFQKAFRRHRTAFVTAAAVFLVVVAGTLVSGWQALRATNAERRAEDGRKREAVLRMNAERERESAIQLKARAELNEYVADVNLAHQSILGGNLSRAKELLARHQPEGKKRFEWRYLWNAAEDDHHQVIARETSSVLSLAASPELIVVGLRNVVNIYSPRTGERIMALAKPGNSVALSSSGLLATSGKNSVRVWRSSDWTETLSLTNCSAPVGFSRDGRLLAANSRGGIRVMDSSTGKLVAEIPNSMPPFALSPTGNAIAVDTREGILLWDLETLTTLRLFKDSKGVFNHSGYWMRDRTALVFSPDGQSVVAARNTLKNDSVFVLDVWAAETGEKATSIPPQSNTIEHTGTIAELAFAPGGELLASTSWDHSVRIWSFKTGQRVKTLHGNPSEIWTLAYAPDSAAVITGGKDGTVRRWPINPVTKETFYEGDWMPLRFSSNGETLVAIDDDSKVVAFNLQTGEPETLLQLGKVSPGKLAPAISGDLRVLVEPIASGFRIWDLQTTQSVHVANPDIVRSWALISPDGSSFVAAGKKDSLLWWNLRESAEPPMRLPGKAALFSGDGRVVVTLLDKSFERWDGRTRTGNAEFSMGVAYSVTAALALSHDGGVLAAGSEAVNDPENAIRLWDTTTGKLLGICRGHTQGIRWLAFAPEGETLASVSDDSTLRFWNVPTQQELISFQRLTNPAREIRFSQNGNWLAVKTLKGLELIDGSIIP
ncbi:MAG: protein kinase [Verrucomicrobiales bacterium]|nr:protein kinase [Verrucomicrobiales bacterium]